MDSRPQFAGRFKKDLSVDNLRVKIARRKSLTQKENRHHEFGKSRGLRLMDPNTSALKGLQAVEELSETSLTHCHENSTVVVETGSKARGGLSKKRHAMLQRYKEEKILRKMKDQREKAQKGVFRCGIYKPDDNLPSLPSVRSVAKTKDKQPQPTTRVTRSAARAEAPPSKTTRLQPVGAGHSFIGASEPAARGHGRGQATKTAEKENHGFPPARTTRATAPRVPTKNTSVAVVKGPKKPSKAPKSQEIPPEPKVVSRILVEEHKAGEVSNKSVKSDAASDPPEPARERIGSFAPENFTFQPPDGLCSYRLQPMTPGTTNRFMSFAWGSSGNAAEAPEDAIEVCEAEVRLPSFHDVTSPACPPPTETTQECTAPPQAAEPQHDVPYFRDALRSEIQRLTSLCAQWDDRTDMAIPDDAKALIRTTVGQTRLLMGERFKQFEGLVDNCEFKRGEKETTCTDLDGFWDMVYFQIEDVVQKFANLRKLEENSWRQNAVQPKKAVKKRSASVAKPNPGDQAKTAAARSRLASIKAAMKKARVLEEVAGAAAADQAGPVVFDAGFFRVESPAKQPSGVKSKRSSLQASALCRSPTRTPPAAPSSGLADGGLWVTPGVKRPVGKALFGDAEQEQTRKSDAEQEQTRKSDAEQEQTRKSDAELEQTRKSDAEQEQTRKSDAEQEQTRKSDAEQEQTRKSDAEQEQTRKSDAEQEQNRKSDAEQDRLNKSETHETRRHTFIIESHPDTENLVKYLVPPEECNLSFGPAKSFELVTGSDTRIHFHILSDGEIEDEVFTCDSERTEQQTPVIPSLAEARPPADQTPDCPGRGPPTDMSENHICLSVISSFVR